MTEANIKLQGMLYAPGFLRCRHAAHVGTRVHRGRGESAKPRQALYRAQL